MGEKKQRQINLAIVAPEYGAYSESFIRAHHELLPFRNFFFHSRRTLGLPTTYGENQSILKGGIGLKVTDKILGRKHWHYSRVKKAFRKYSIDVVLAEYGPIGANMSALCQALNIPLIVHFHGYDASSYYVLDSYKELYRKMFDYSSFIIAVSEVMKKKLIDIGASEEKVVLNTYGPNDSFFNVSSKLIQKKLVGIGRFVDKKAPYYTLLAFSKVHKDHPDAKLVIGGDGILLNTCRNLAKALGLEKNVLFPGVITADNFKNELSTARGFVQHSVVAEDGDMEGTPLAVLEASASGIPVISTRHGGIPEVIVHNETGLLVDEHDVEGMASHMRSLLDDIELAKTLGENGRRRIQEKFTLKQHIDMISKLVVQAFDEKNT